MNEIKKSRKSRTGSKIQGAIPAFLLKTYEILENSQYADIISWNKEGTAFVVKKINEFSEKILPKYFKHNNFASFVRQLNMYDFHKARHDNNENEFRHRLFRRGQNFRAQLAEIHRKTTDIFPVPQNQLVPVTTLSKEFDLEKFKKECSAFSNELSTLKTRQSELEKMSKLIFSQNTHIQKENQLLWNELKKNKEKYERKIDKLVMFIYSIMHYGGNAQLPANLSKKGLQNMDFDFIMDDHTKPEVDNEVALISNERPTDTEQAFKKLMKYIKSKNDEQTFDQLIDSLNKSGKFGNYIHYLNDIDENNLIEPYPVDAQNKKKKKIPRQLNMIENNDSLDEFMPRKQIKAEDQTSINMIADDNYNQTIPFQIGYNKDDDKTGEMSDEPTLNLSRNNSIGNYLTQSNDLNKNESLGPGLLAFKPDPSSFLLDKVINLDQFSLDKKESNPNFEEPTNFLFSGDGNIDFGESTFN